MHVRQTIVAAALLAATTASAALAFGRPAMRTPLVPQSPADPATGCKVVYLSDRTGAADLLYSSNAPFGAYATPVMPAVDNGWGLYARSDVVYAGSAPNQINVYKPCGTQAGYTYTTFGLGAPTSIAADNAGNVYATENGTSTVDWFAGITDTATTDPPRAPGLPSYLAVDNAGNVYTSGWDPTNTFEQIDVCGPGMAPCAVCEVISAPSWPGGVALDRFQHLIVNDELGTIHVFNAGCGTQASQYTYSAPAAPHHFHFTAITLSSGAENFIWGAKQFDMPNAIQGCTSPFCMDAQGEHYNAVTGTVGAIAGPRRTATIPGHQPGSGIAVFPPGAV